MKEIFKLFILASLVIAGCAKISTEDTPKALQPMTFSAMVSDEPDAKAAIDGLDIKWSAGDEIGVFDGTAVQKFTLKSGAGTTSAVFEGEAVKAGSYIAVYPYNENLAVSDGKITGLSVPRIQTAGACPVIMTAECKDGGNAFAFKSALAYVKVTPGFVCHKIVLETYEADSDGCDLCGEVELASGSARVVGNPCSHVILSGEIVSGNSYLIGVAPKCLSKGFKVIFDASDDNLQYARKSVKHPELVRGRVLNLGEFTKDTNWTENGVKLASFEEVDQILNYVEYHAVYDWKDFTRIAACCREISTSKRVEMHFLEDIDFGGSRLNTTTLDIANARITIYGHGHKIFNYEQGYVDDDGDRYAGLFYVKNLWGISFNCLSLYPNKFELGHDDDIYGGAFVACIHCTDRLDFENCQVHGNISVSCTGMTSEAYAGGFCGMVKCDGDWNLPQDLESIGVRDCLMDGSVTAYSEDDMAYAGGFIGIMEAYERSFECKMSRCRNRAIILAQGDDDYNPIEFNQGGISAGGMVGCDRDLFSGGDIALALNYCVNEGSVTAHAMDNDNSFAGGMVGCHDSDGVGYTYFEVRPSVSNCLNRGSITVKGGTGWLGTTAGLASGMAGYCYTDRTVFSNCVDDGKLSSDDICAHISGTNGTYGDYKCYWTNKDIHAGIHKKDGDKGGYKADLSLSDLTPGDGEQRWLTADGHLDIDIIR